MYIVESVNCLTGGDYRLTKVKDNSFIMTGSASTVSGQIIKVDIVDVDTEEKLTVNCCELWELYKKDLIIGIIETEFPDQYVDIIQIKLTWFKAASYLEFYGKSRRFTNYPASGVEENVALIEDIDENGAVLQIAKRIGRDYYGSFIIPFILKVLRWSERDRERVLRVNGNVLTIIKIAKHDHVIPYMAKGSWVYMITDTNKFWSIMAKLKLSGG